MWPKVAILAIALNPAAGLAADAPDTTKVMAESTVTATRVDPSSLGYVKATRADGSVEYLADHRIHWIRDAAGHDWTEQVMERGKGHGDGAMLISFGPKGEAPHRSLLRGAPAPAESWFPIIQAGFLTRLDPNPFYFSSPIASLSMDMGVMKNVGRHFAVGANAYYAEDDDYSRIGGKLRVRRWVSHIVAVDAAPGVIFADDKVQNESLYLPGFVGELGLTFGDAITITGQMEARRTKQYATGWAYSRNGFPPPGIGTEVSWYLGAKLGGEFALGAFVAAALVAAIEGTTGY